jgi:hypothetical protein
METTTESGKKGKFSVSFFAIMMVVTCAAPIWFFFIGPQMRHDRLAEKGIRAPGRLLAIDESGTVINDVPELELLVEFTRKDGTLDTAETDFVPSRRTLHMFQEGTGVIAAYDPEDPNEITLLEVSDGKPAPGTSGMGVMSSPDVDSLRHVADSLTAEMEKLKKK